MKNLIKLRIEHPVLRRRKFFQGRRIRGTDIKDIMWLRADGQEMSDEDWEASWVRCIGVLLAGEIRDEIDEKGDQIKDDTLLVLLNSYHESVPFTLPEFMGDVKWQVIVNTSTSDLTAGERQVDGKKPLEVASRSAIVLRCRVEK